MTTEPRALVLLGNRMLDDNELWFDVAKDSKRVLDSMQLDAVIITGNSPHEAAWMEFVTQIMVLDIELRTVSLAGMKDDWATSWFEYWLQQFTYCEGNIRWYDRTEGKGIADFLLTDVELVLIINDGEQIDWNWSVVERAQDEAIPIVWIKAGPPVSVVRIKNKERE